MTEREPKIYVLHENESWVKPLFESFKELNIPYYDWFINNGKLNLNDVPPDGIFYNRMSASSHTREHRYAVELTESILSWLEFHNRKVINGRKALTLEVRKVEQQLALNSFGIDTPKTIVTNNPNDLLQAAQELNSFPFIVKPNRGGKGLGVKKYDNINQLKQDIDSKNLPESLDGIFLLQEFIQASDGRITRMEFIGGKFYYAVSIDSSGGFELCPADSCNLDGLFCPASANDLTSGADQKFKIIDKYVDANIQQYHDFLNASGIEIGAIEFIQDSTGKNIVYDVNTNTNYNSKAEKADKNQYQGMRKIAEYLKLELDKLSMVKI